LPPGAEVPAVLITATRVPIRVDQALAETTVITRALIEQAAGRTLPELLAGQPGVQFWSNGGVGKIGSVSLRGLEARHTLLLVDGVRYGSATVGTPTWETLPLDSIERIEIVRGPMSGLYGSEAVGGVVQIFTRSGAEGLRANGSVAYGSQRTARLGAGLRWGHGPFDGAVQLSTIDTQGLSATNASVPFGNHNPDDDGFKQSSATLRLGWRLAPSWRAEASALVSDGEAQFDDGPGADALQGLRAQVLGVQLAGTVTAGWRTTVRLSRAVDESETIRTASAFGAPGTTATRQSQLTLENTLATPLGTALLVAERQVQHVSRPGAPYTVSERTIQGLAFGLDGQADAHSWQASIRHDRNSQFGSQTTGSLAYGLLLLPGLRAAASWGTSFVAPSFNQLYFPNFGNPNLIPEEGQQREISLRWQHAGVSTRLAYFDNRIRGYISSGPLPANIPRARVDGISASVDAQWGPLAVAASLDSLNPVNASTGTNLLGNLLPRRAQDIGRLSLDWRAGALTLGTTLSAVGSRFDNAANTVRVAGYATVDLRAEWKPAPAWALALRLNNAGGTRYETVQGYNQPGREAHVTLRYAGL
jgi:vitamin B12 transporter